MKRELCDPAFRYLQLERLTRGVEEHEVMDIPASLGASTVGRRNFRVGNGPAHAPRVNVLLQA